MLTYFSVGTELCFPFLIWFSSTRRFILALILVLHLGLILTMNTLWFNYTMIACLVLFLTNSEVESVEKYMMRGVRRILGRKTLEVRAARF